VSAFTVVGGIEWCSTHHGIVDEIGAHPDGPCDLADVDGKPCVIHEVWIDGSAFRLVER
jgi:hypothetical protein